MWLYGPLLLGGTQIQSALALTQTATYSDSDVLTAPTISFDQALTQSAKYSDADTFYVHVVSLVLVARSEAFRSPQLLLDFNGADASTTIIDGSSFAPVLLLHCDGVDASTTFRDESGHAVTPNGTAQIDTAQSKFGGASGLFNSATLDSLTVADSADFGFGAGDFSIDLWVRFNSLGNDVLVDLRSSGKTGNPLIYIDSSELRYFCGDTRIAHPWFTRATGTWYHIAVSRSGSSTRLFLDGTQVGSTYTALDAFTSSAQVNVGCGFDLTTYPHDGWIEELRILKGFAAFTSNFTPPTTPYISSGHAITANNGAQIDIDQFKFGNSSLLLSTANAHLSFDNANDLALTDDFTLDFWFRLNAVPATTFARLFTSDVPSTQFVLDMRGASNDQVQLSAVGGSAITSSLSAGTWYHIAVTRSAGVMRLFLNGTQQGSNISDSTSYTVSSGYPHIGDESRTLGAWIDEFRIIKGYAFWTSNFASPVAECGQSGDDLVFNALVAQALVQTATYNPGDAFFTHVVTPGAVNLAPSLYTDADTVSFAHAVGRVIQPSLYTDADAFFTHQINRAILPSLYSDTDAVTFTHVVTSTIALTQTATHTDSDAFFTHVISRVLQPPPLTDNDAFFTHDLVRVLQPPLLTDSDTPFAPSVVRVLSPTLCVDTDTVNFVHVVTPGSVDLAPTLFTDVDNVSFNHFVGTGGALGPPLYTETDGFFTHTVTPGAVNLSPTLYADTDAFFTHTISRVVQPPLYLDGDTFFTLVVTPGSVNLSPTLFTDGDALFTHVISKVLQPPLYTDADAFFTPAIRLFLTPSLYVDGDTFFTHTIAITQSLFASLYVDPDTFFGPTVQIVLDQDLQPSLFLDPSVLFHHIVSMPFGTLSDRIVAVGSEFRLVAASSENRLVVVDTVERESTVDADDRDDLETDDEDRQIDVDDETRMV